MIIIIIFYSYISDFFELVFYSGNIEYIIDNQIQKYIGFGSFEIYSKIIITFCSVGIAIKIFFKKSKRLTQDSQIEYDLWNEPGSGYDISENINNKLSDDSCKDDIHNIPYFSITGKYNGKRLLPFFLTYISIVIIMLIIYTKNVGWKNYLFQLKSILIMIHPVILYFFLTRVIFYERATITSKYCLQWRLLIKRKIEWEKITEIRNFKTVPGSKVSILKLYRRHGLPIIINSSYTNYGKIKDFILYQQTHSSMQSFNNENKKMNSWLRKVNLYDFPEAFVGLVYIFYSLLAPLFMLKKMNLL